ncbi:hypothetical protein BOTBODRAFT_165190 [Botryobasidium botryosum FD-172 SS1]|uniref:Golgi apparatus membrane protein TVP38 n=1 Tax=Botryobasidium botryosum (strain FD-172 SS1) TaxID=930990 RepID=A0A067MC29_BOTB1|nr:hypothetical protein BOTBODRAFT_165190 [Botryobasidium botryosum FD-172 SS1]
MSSLNPQVATHDAYRASEDTFVAPQPSYPYQKYGSPANRGISRTPSPTPSENAALAQKTFVDFKSLFKLTKGNIVRWIIIALLLALTIVTSVLHNQIVKGLQPAADWIHKLPAGWLIPVAILFVISFPPLFGHEIVSIMCGLVWGPGIGFAIVCLGSFLGELANYFTFRYCCQARSEKIRSKSIQYAALTKVIQNGGVKVAIIARYSIIPGHVVTAIFATCGMSLQTFIISAIASLPNQFINVYIGYTFETSANNSDGGKSKTISTIVTVVTIAITIFAMRYITSKVNAVKPEVIYARRKARQYAGNTGYPTDDESTIALNARPQSNSPPYPAHSATYSTTYPPTTYAPVHQAEV